MNRLLSRILPAALLLITQAASACPMCKDSIPGEMPPSGGDPSQMSGGGLPEGFNYSVYIMLIGFLGTLGLVGWTIYKGLRTTSTRPAAQIAQPTVGQARTV